MRSTVRESGSCPGRAEKLARWQHLGGHGGNLAIGIDLGGTNIVGGLVTRGGRVLLRGHRMTESWLGGRHVLENILDLLDEIWRRSVNRRNRVAALGLGTPGLLNQASGVIEGGAKNLRGWKGIPVLREMSARVGRPAFGGNDVTVHALGEARCGAGRGSRVMVCYALGTGIGGGIVIDGQAFFGSRGYAGEVGHQTVALDGARCNCGSRGCVERYSSASGVVRLARDAMKKRRSILRRMSGGDDAGLTAKMVFDAARRGDVVARSVVEDAARYLGAAVANTVNILNPDLVVIGGGVAKAGVLLMRPLMKHFREYVLPLSAKDVRVVRGELGDDAGVIGAALVAFQMLGSMRR